MEDLSSWTAVLFPSLHRQFHCDWLQRQLLILHQQLCRLMFLVPVVVAAVSLLLLLLLMIMFSIMGTYAD